MALASTTQPMQAVSDLDIEEDVVEETAKATAYRYWIDDSSNKKEMSLSGEDIEADIDASSLTIGIHIYHIQLRDQNGKWYAAQDIPFYAGCTNTEGKEDDSTIPSVKKVIYWLDDDVTNQTTLAYTQADIAIEKDITNMATGSHSYTVMAVNSQNRVAVANGTFLIPSTIGEDSGETENITPVSYQYWVDNDKEHAVTLPYTSGDISQQIDYTGLAGGAHTLHFRIKNSEGAWNSSEYTFYTPGSNTEQADTQQPITGYRYGVNSKSTTKNLTEVDNIPSLNVEIAIPTAADIANVEDYEFTTDNNSKEVKVKWEDRFTYYLQFKNKAGTWGEPVFIDSLVSNSEVRTAKDLTVNRTLGIQKIAKGDCVIAKFDITDDNGYYLGASENCQVMLYQDNKRQATLSAEQMTANKSSYLTKGTYFAVIYNQDEDGSIRLANSSDCVADPAFSYSGHTLSITSSTAGATIYYTLDGSTPTEESTQYTGAIPMTYNSTVKAIAMSSGKADSYIKSYDVNDFDVQTCAQPVFNYDGRTVKLTSTEANADIYYTQDGSDPTGEEGRLYNGEGITIESLGTMKAYATKKLMNNSEVVTFEIPAYYNGKGLVEVKTAGNLSKAFEWNNGDVDSDTLQVLGNINTTDVAALRNMTGIKHLDLNKASVASNTLPDQAFANMNLRSASLPASLTACGKELFSGNKQLAAVIWNANQNMSAEVLSGIDNPNLLLYVNTKSYAPSSVTNVVAGGVADNIVLSEPGDGQTGNFYAPTAFTAKKISYTRNFKQETEIGVCQGWETIALPFEATSITHETNGKIAPFAKGDNEAHPFWLYELAPNGGFQATATLKANTPYIISMPNSQSYSDEYILGGNVTFSGSDVTIEATEQAKTRNNSREFITSFEQIGKSTGIYALNVGKEYEGYRPGSIFAEDFIDLKPFEAYLTTAEAAAKFRSFFGGDDSTTGINALPTKEISGVKVWTNGSTLNIASDTSRRMQVFSTAGMLVKTVEVEAGVTTSISDLPSGIYIVNKKKVAIQ